jgi:serine/threonine protein kinase
MIIKRIGKYTVQRQLGTGVHSTILQISRHEDGKQYALKIVPIDSAEDQKFRTQAEHEFAVAQKFDHPNLIKIYGLETQTDWLFRPKKLLLLIEFVPGQTLDKFKSLAIKRLVPIFEQVASGMVHMHRNDVMHADLKPGNIMVSSRTGQAKVIDFGLAWIRGESKGRVQGTPEYMAPETVAHGVVNEKTDIFNFGATMYRLVTWKFPPSLVPQPGSVRMNSKVYSQILTPVAQANPATPPALADLITRCLQFSPDQRPERMSEIQGILDKLAEELGSPDDETGE